MAIQGSGYRHSPDRFSRWLACRRGILYWLILLDPNVGRDTFRQRLNTFMFSIVNLMHAAHYRFFYDYALCKFTLKLTLAAFC